MGGNSQISRRDQRASAGRLGRSARGDARGASLADGGRVNESLRLN